MGNWRDNVRHVVPYVPGEQPQKKVIKLNTNENPYPPAKGVDEIMKTVDSDIFRLYPDPECMVLRKAIADRYNTETDNVFVGVGSDDVISVAFLTFFNSDKKVLFPNITYSFYTVWADLYGIDYELIPVDKNFRIHKEDYYKENGGVVFANPNAPTSIGEPLDFVIDILENNKDVVVIVDEAYVDFGGESAVELTKKYDNLLVVQTFSKSRSMAGMRIGYAIGNSELIKAMSDVKYSINSYTLNQVSLKSGVAAIEDEAYFKEKVNKIVATRERVKKEIKELGFEFPDSKTNFIFAKHESVPSKHIFEELKKVGIYVRYFSAPIVNEYLRITIGTDEEMDKFIEELKKIIK